MNYITSKYINTFFHPFVGVIWSFRGCQVEMHKQGFTCNCKDAKKDKCKHIKSVEFGILGVDAKEYRLEPVRA
jgi:hypothetical protein